MTKPSYSEVKDLLDACPFFYATNKKNKNHKYKYFDITRPVNQPIKDLLIDTVILEQWQLFTYLCNRI